MLLKDLIEQYANYEVKDGFMEFLERPKPKSVWDLKVGDRYYVLKHNGIIKEYKWANLMIEVLYRNQGNIFLTYEEAQFELKRKEVYTQVKRFAHDFSRDEWKNVEIIKFFPLYDYKKNEIVIWNNHYIKYAITYFESKEDVQKAIDAVGEENFKKYYLGVKE